MSKKIIIPLELNNDEYILELDPVSRKNLNMRIKPNNTIHVSKPFLFSKQQVINYIEENKEWIINKSHQVNERHQNRNRYIRDEYVIIFNQKVHVKDNPNIIGYLDDILMNYINERRSYYDNLYNRKPEIIIKNMKGKWGYCSVKQNKLVFNSKLVHYPKEVIDYVILHEYTHFLVPNHSKDFYNLIQKDMPNYKEVIQYLRHN